MAPKSKAAPAVGASGTAPTKKLSSKSSSSTGGMWSGENSSESVGIGPLWIRTAFLPAFLVLATPLTSIILGRAVTSTDPNVGFLSMGQEVIQEIIDTGLIATYTRDAMNPYVWKMIGLYCLVQLLLMRFMPGEIYEGPKSPMGNVPIYKDNAFACYVASFVLYGLGMYFGLYNGGVVFDHFHEWVATMNIVAIILCSILYVKGAVAPSSTDSGLSGNFPFDYYWGTELYPRIFGWDVKVYTNCRYGMTGWALLCVSFACAQYERFGEISNSMLISAVLQVIYLAKFHIWERGYMFTIDIMHDRAGHYICWGCLVWVPSVYCCPPAFLVLHPYNFPTWVAVGMFVFCLVSIYLNYDIDRQRQEFRAKDGKMKIWGKDAEYLVADYQTGDGKKHSSLLLYSGWWGKARKINYFFELCAGFTWSCIVAHPFCALAYPYFAFLFILLIDRAWRDDARCADKYGEKWEEYKKLVPYLMIPGII